MRILIAFLAAVWAAAAQADTVVPTHTIRAQSILTAEDLMLLPETTAGAYSKAELLYGQETRVALYAGRPVRMGDVGPPAVIERNQIVVLEYIRGTMAITAEGRAMERGAAGDWIRVMNLTSRTTITGQIQPNGTILTSQ